MDSDDFEDNPATPGGGETPLHDEDEGQECNQETQEDEYNPELAKHEDDEEMLEDELERPVEEEEDVRYNMDELSTLNEDNVQQHSEMDEDIPFKAGHGSHHSDSLSPAYSMTSPQSPPGSPIRSNNPASPADSEGPASPAGYNVGPVSPLGSQAGSVASASPARSDGPASPVLSDAPGSPMDRNAPVSPTGSGGAPESPAGSIGVASPTRSIDPASPAMSEEPASPARSREPASPSRSGEPASPARSGEPASPARSREPASPARSGEPASPARSGEPASPARSSSSRQAGSGDEEMIARSASGSPHSPAHAHSAASSPRHSNDGSPPSSPISRNERRAIESDSEDEDRIAKTKAKGKRRIKASDDEDSEREVAKNTIHSDSEDEDKVPKRKGKHQKRGSGDEESDLEGTRRALLSDSGDEEAAAPRPGKRKARASDDEESDKGSNVGELIDDIFGKSDEEEEFEGFGEADVASYSKKDKKGFGPDDEEDMSEGKSGENILPELSSDEEGGSSGRRNRPDGFVSDFDLMLQKRKAEMQRRRKRRKDCEILNDSDDVIEDMIKKMKEAAEADRELNKHRKPAVKVLCMLPMMRKFMQKIDLHNAMIDGGMLPAITEWLAPLPDKSLPHLEVRETMLKQLLEFASISTEGLRMSGLGKAVMYLFKHPRETRANKEVANRLINEWSRPIFNPNADYKMTKEYREQRDYETLPKKRRVSIEGGAPNSDIGKALSGEEKVLRPGDPGYVYRARVPQPSNREYIVRPKWNVDEKPCRGSSKKPGTKLDKYVRKSKTNKFQSAVKISIEGRNLAL